MICISPMAPFSNRAHCLPSLSTRMTARIQCSGTQKRLDASITNAAKGWTVKPFGRRVVDDPCSPCAAPPNSIDPVRIATMHITVPRGRKPAVVLAAVNGEALSGRLGDHP